ncbi:MAG: hypothetical protein MZV65_15835 [Chromatiales bacterium]|nr:hypothetical protein [Chromatiales bacterium]
MSDEILDQVVLFYLGEAWAGMTDISGVLETASRVDPKDPRSWTPGVEERPRSAFRAPPEGRNPRDTA